MSIDHHLGKAPPSAAPAPTWGEITPEGQSALVVRFCMEEKTVTIPFGEFKRWEHVRSETETIALMTSRELVVIEGRELLAIRVALDLMRLAEVRPNYRRLVEGRPGPRVQRISIEPS